MLFQFAFISAMIRNTPTPKQRKLTVSQGLDSSVWAEHDWVLVGSGLGWNLAGGVVLTHPCSALKGTVLATGTQPSASQGRDGILLTQNGIVSQVLARMCMLTRRCC